MATFSFNSALAQDKIRGWHEFINAEFGTSTIDIGDASIFAGAIECASLGPLTLTEIRATREHGERTKSHVAGDKNEHFVLVLLRSGRLRVAQNGRECWLGPNSFTLFDCNAPYVFEHVEATDVLDLSIPTGMLRSRVKHPHEFVAIARAADTGLGRVMAEIVQSLAREAARIPADAAHRCAGRVADMIGVWFDSGHEGLRIENSAVRSGIYRRCAVYIEEHLGDPELVPARIAAATGISLRYLHKIFHELGESVGEFMRRRRLDHCYEELTNVGRSRVTVKEVAFQFGFKNVTHFASAFKQHHGMSPSDVRRTARHEATDRHGSSAP